MRNIEHIEQVHVVSWFDLTFKHLSGRLFAIPNGGKRHKLTAYKLKSEGVRAGVPDLFLPLPNKSHHGLFIEMKAKKGKTTELQNDWINFLNKSGYLACVCFGLDEAKNKIKEYIDAAK